MDYSEPDSTAVTSAKIVIAGGFGVGKTTLVGSVSDIEPLRTEALVTDESSLVDDLSALPRKDTTTVAMDFGRINLAEDLVLYVFGTPGQNRFWFMWDDLVRGAIGAIILIDTRRLDDSFAAVDYFESKGLPFVVAINEFDGAARYPVTDIRQAMALPPEVPIIAIDARDRDSARGALITLSQYALASLPPLQPATG
ncbi:ATP/GTP-binding protein [Tsukamurella sp. NPDC003166]|uniref:GTP-binding protein n=1 Tax=Tsukamurella sp. NPDC003166 TaxID=3154444 RepID=UPI0033BBA521